jgi:hypothetical protein
MKRLTFRIITKFYLKSGINPKNEPGKLSVTSQKSQVIQAHQSFPVAGASIRIQTQIKRRFVRQNYLSVFDP